MVLINLTQLELSVPAVFDLPWRKVKCSHGRGDTLGLRDYRARWDKGQ